MEASQQRRLSRRRGRGEASLHHQERRVRARAHGRVGQHQPRPDLRHLEQRREEGQGEGDRGGQGGGEEGL